MIKNFWYLLLLFCSAEAYLYDYETPIVKYLKPIEISENPSGLQYVDCIYVINLDERPQKWKRMKTLFNEHGLNVNRVSGINGWLIPHEIKQELAGPYTIHYNGGQLGCLLSHISIIKDANLRNLDLIWILEDDVEFLGDLNQIPPLLEKLSQIDPDWDIFYTDLDFRHAKGGYLPVTGLDPRPDQELPSIHYFQQRTALSNEIMQIRIRYGTHSMLISKKGVQKILDYFTHIYLWPAIDGDLHYIPGIREYATRKDLVSNWRHCPFSDTIGNSSLNTH